MIKTPYVWFAGQDNADYFCVRRLKQRQAIEKRFKGKAKSSKDRQNGHQPAH
jgi:hypothetical protein